MNYHFQANNTNGLWQTATSNPEDYTVILLIELHQGKTGSNSTKPSAIFSVKVRDSRLAPFQYHRGLTRLVTLKIR